MTVASPVLSHHDQDALEWYLAQTTTERSTFGASLERAVNIAHGSDGKKHRRPDLTERDAEGHVVGMRQLVYVRRQQGEGGGYELTETETERFAHVGPILAAIARSSPLAYVTLCLYYGNAGRRWAGQNERQLWCLVELTTAGKRRLETLAQGRREKGQPESPLSPAEQLASEARVQKLSPDAERGAALRRMADQAELLLIEAHRAWNEASGE